MPIDPKSIQWDDAKPSGIVWDKNPPPIAGGVDPTSDMSVLDTVRAGIGRGMTAATRAALQGFSKIVGADAVGAGLVKQTDIDEARKTDAPLLNTKSGAVGNVIGNAAIAAPSALIPGANTYLGATAIGSGIGALTTEGGLPERLHGAAWGGAGGAAGKALGDGLASGARWVADRAATKSAQRAAEAAQKSGVAQAAAREGYVIPPADLNPGVFTEMLNGLSGKIKTAQVASQRNQGVTNTLARRSIGLADDAELTADVLHGLRGTAAASGYAPVKQAGQITTDKAYEKALDAISSQYQGAARSFPGVAKNEVAQMVEGLKQPKFDAGDALDMVKVLRETADKAYRTGDSGMGKAAKAAALAIEEQIDRGLSASGDTAAISAFREARKAIAKTYSVQKALNPATGDVSATALAKQFQAGRPLSDELLTIGQVASAFPKATQALKESPKALSPLDFAVGAIGAGSSGPLAAVTMAARPAVRSLLLSGPYQRAAMAAPSGTPGLLSQAPAAVLDRELTRRLMPGLLSIGALDYSQ